MELPQLKLLAGRIRGLLQQSSTLIGHSQALDLVAAVPGLRNWPEVMAFPDRVAACELDTASAGRLAFRLKKSFPLEFSAKELLSALVPPDSARPPQRVLQVWPGGPPSGVYVTTSTQAITALLARYEDATDGGLVYAEGAASGWEGSIDLGDYGLWSSGIDRLASGTLLVVGPIELDQQSWDDAARRLDMACLHALNSDHRVAVLVNTPTPDRLCEDLVVLLQSASEDPSDVASALAGVVLDNGDLEPRKPFAAAYPTPRPIRANVGLEALPVSTRETLRRELALHTTGVILFASSDISNRASHDQLAAGLALTGHAGPAARIMPRHRSTPEKDWLVPDAIKALPFLPSIESAYAQGYRRMVVDPNYSSGDLLLKYEDVLFLGGAYGHGVASIALRLLATSGQNEFAMLSRLVAVLSVFPVPHRRGYAVASDLFIRRTSPGPVRDYDQFEAFLRAHRVVRWEEELACLLDSGVVTLAGIKRASGRHHAVTEFLAQRRTVRKAS